VQRDYRGLDTRMLRLEAVRRMIGAMVGNVIDETTRNLETTGVETADDVRALTTQVVAFSDAMLADLSQLRHFLYTRMYRHHRVNRSRSAARRILGDLFDIYMSEPDVLPESWLARTVSKDASGRARVVCDYIAGMTDRFAIEEHRKLFRFDEWRQ
jgi:dGTPase